MNENTKEIISLYDGKLSSVEISRIVGLTPRYVRKVAKKHNLERLHRGAQSAQKNHRFVSGRRIDLDGYVLVTAPPNHPYARKRPNRENWIMLEHRLVMEHKLGRYLLPEEVVDHIDGLTLHNDPSNLRLFSKNSDHLRETTTGISHLVSLSGLRNTTTKSGTSGDFLPVDIYRLRKERGDVRLRQILLAALKLGIDSPFLLGTHRHLKKAQIDFSSRSNLKHALGSLYKRWEEDLSR